MAFRLCILADTDCEVFVDAEYHGMAKADDKYWIELESGAYFIECICNNSKKFLFYSKRHFSFDYHTETAIMYRPVFFHNWIDYMLEDDDIVVDKYCFGSYAKATKNGCHFGYIYEDLYQSNNEYLVYEQLQIINSKRAFVSRNNKWGCIERDGNEIIPAIYDEIFKFNDNLVIAKHSEGYYGIFSISSGERISSLEYQDVWPQNACFAIAKYNNKQVLINKYGKKITPVKYDKIGDPISDNLIPVNIGACYDHIRGVQKNGLWGIIDKYGLEVVRPQYKYIGKFYDGLAAVRKYEITKNGKWGYINLYFDEIIPCHYDYASAFVQGLATVRTGSLIGIINNRGDEIVPPKYERIENFSEGLASVTLNGKLGYINTSGQEIIPLIYDWGAFFSEGLACIALNSKYGYVDIYGKVVIPPMYDNAGNFVNGLAPVCLNNAYGAINSKGKVIIPFQYDYISDFNEEGLALIRLKREHIPITFLLHSDIYGYYEIHYQTGIINTAGEQIGSLYDKIRCFSEGYAGVKLNDKWGYINIHGKEIIPIIYDEVGEFENGIAQVWLNRTFLYINNKGEVIEPEDKDLWPDFVD